MREDLKSLYGTQVFGCITWSLGLMTSYFVGGLYADCGILGIKRYQMSVACFNQRNDSNRDATHSPNAVTAPNAEPRSCVSASPPLHDLPSPCSRQRTLPRRRLNRQTISTPKNPSQPGPSSRARLNITSETAAPAAYTRYSPFGFLDSRLCNRTAAAPSMHTPPA